MIASKLRPLKLEISRKFFSATSITENIRAEIPTYAKICEENFEFLFTTEPPAPSKLRCLLRP